MTGGSHTSRLGREDAAALLALLGNEEAEYRRLRRLAWRQTAYLKRGDTDRLERNAGEWRQYLPVADAARQRREAGVRSVADRLGVAEARPTVDLLAERAAPEVH